MGSSVHSSCPSSNSPINCCTRSASFLTDKMFWILKCTIIMFKIDSSACTVHAGTHTHMQAYKHVHTHACAHAHTQTCTRTHTHTHACPCVCTHTHTHAHTHIYTRPHTHIHTPTHYSPSRWYHNRVIIRIQEGRYFIRQRLPKLPHGLQVLQQHKS